jgi:hypothetical protein
MELEFKKDEIWLCDFFGDLEPVTIIEVTGNFAHHKYKWEATVDFRKRAKAKIGTVRRLLGFRIGVIPSSRS